MCFADCIFIEYVRTLFDEQSSFHIHIKFWQLTQFAGFNISEINHEHNQFITKYAGTTWFDEFGLHSCIVKYLFRWNVSNGYFIKKQQPMYPQFP